MLSFEHIKMENHFLRIQREWFYMFENLFNI